MRGRTLDASTRDWRGGSGTATWVLGCLLLRIVVFPIDLWKRGRAPLKDARLGAGTSLSAETQYRECPHCKDGVRRDASTCLHCRLESGAWRLYGGAWWYRSQEERWYWLDERSGMWARAPSGVFPPDGAQSGGEE